MKKALFFINSLSNGGAERVVINLAEEMIKQNYHVDIIVLGKNNSNQQEYNINSKINIYNLKINCTNKILKILKILLSIKKVNNIINIEEKKGNYNIITSHLPMSNLVTRLSIVKNRAIYVFHLPLKRYDKLHPKVLYTAILNFMFKNKKIVAVSDGVRDEAINKYGFNKNNIVTIYNPVNQIEINEKMKEKIDFKSKYFLHVGRFGEQKRQDLTLDIFYKGKFYQKYNLIYCGEGETKEIIKKRAIEYGIEDSVYFLDWQSNIYKWMHNSELLIMNSLYESFAMVIVEALICGTRVVAYDCDFGPREIMKNEYEKYLVKIDSVEEYIKKINEALEKYPKTKNEFISLCKPDMIVNQYLEFMNK